MRCAGVAIAVVVCVSMTSLAYGDFTFVSQSVQQNFDGTTDFSITFNRVPDFTIVDTVGRQQSAFQFMIYGDVRYASIIRGPEIHLSGSMLRIRNGSGSSGDPGSGGWGTVITEVPWVLDDKTVTFSVQTSLLTTKFFTDGGFRYDVLATEYGASTRNLQGLSSVPEPSTFSLLGLGGLTLGFFCRRRIAWCFR